MSEIKHPPVDVPDDDDQKRPLSRRSFLKRSGMAAASASAATITLHEVRTAEAQDATPVVTPAATPVVSEQGGMTSEDRAIRFFNPREAELVDALVSRILPGSPDDPGAHEAGVVFYIDRNLGGTNQGYNLKTYRQGPFLVVSEESVPVERASARDIYDFVTVASDQVSRYGYQSVLAPQEIYRRGLEAVDAYAQSLFQKAFVELSTDQQDQILTDMEADKATGFEGPSGKALFTQLRNDTIEGMFGDPMYGGNRDLAGWKLIGYPGAQRFYTPDDIKNQGFQRGPQSLAELMANESH